MRDREYTFGEHLFYGAAVASWISCPVMIVLAIWSDTRWFAMAALAIVLGLVFAYVAGKMEEE